VNGRTEPIRHLYYFYVLVRGSCLGHPFPAATSTIPSPTFPTPITTSCPPLHMASGPCGTQLLRRQYLYFCTRKASTFAPVKQVYLEVGAPVIPWRSENVPSFHRPHHHQPLPPPLPPLPLLLLRLFDPLFAHHLRNRCQGEGPGLPPPSVYTVCTI
jgi:hypothetical protein